MTCVCWCRTYWCLRRLVLGAVAVVAVAAIVARRRTAPAGDSDDVEVESAGESIGGRPTDLGLALPAAVVVLGSAVLVAGGPGGGAVDPAAAGAAGRRGGRGVAGAARAVRAGVAVALCGLALFHVAEMSRLSPR